MQAKDILLYTDMDGTALTDWALGPVLPQQNLEALMAFTQAGGLFSVASGRLPDSILQWFPQGVVNAPVVCCNGAMLIDPATRQVLCHQELHR